MASALRCTAACTLAALLAMGAAMAGEDESAPPSKPLTVEQAVDAVLTAYEPKDEAALKALAEKDDPDPWLLADELCFRGKHDAAEAFAKAAPRMDCGKLPAYVAAWRKREPDEAERALLAVMKAALQARTPMKVVEATVSLAEAPATVTRIQLAHSRGTALRQVQRLSDSAAVLRAAGDAARALGWLRGAGRLYRGAGLSAYQGSDWPRALDLWMACLAVMEGQGNQAGAATALSSIGDVYRRLGDYAKALSFHERALERKQATGDEAGVATMLGGLGGDYYRLGDYAKALSFYERALEQRQALGDKAGVARLLQNIGTVYRSLRDYATALSILERALRLMEALDDRAGVAATLGSIGLVYFSLGDCAQALSFHGRALAQMEALGDRAGAAGTLANIGIVYHRLGNLPEARRWMERSARAARSLRSTPLRVAALSSLAAIHLQADQPSRALSAAQTALEAIEGMLGGLDEEVGATARGQQARLFSIGTIAAVREEDAAEALTFLESGRAGALLDALGRREALRWKAESLPEDLRAADRAAQAAQRVARHGYDRALQKGDQDEIRRTAKALDEATERVRALAGRIQREMMAQARLFYPRAEALETIQLALDADQALVLYGLCLNKALAIVLRQDGERIVELGTVKEVEAACQAAAPLLSSPGDRGRLGQPGERMAPEDASKLLDRLRTLLVVPLKLGEDVKQVLVSPEGSLCYLPFGALFDQTVTMTPSGSTHVLLLDEELGEGEGVLALGDPDYAGITEGAQAIYYRGRTLSKLPATRPEVEAIATKALLGAKASEVSLKEALAAKKRWKAVHFACHGLIDVERPMLSSLVLSADGEEDGFLTALEVLRMQIPADLAVLSACETGKGRVVKGEGIVGLTRAFMFAGAPRVLCSLWRVDDEATRALMVKFYELWSSRAKPGDPEQGPGGGVDGSKGKSKGLGAAEALEQAQAFVRGHEKWKHPYYWAAWTLWGLPK